MIYGWIIIVFCWFTVHTSNFRWIYDVHIMIYLRVNGYINQVVYTWRGHDMRQMMILILLHEHVGLGLKKYGPTCSNLIN